MTDLGIGEPEDEKTKTKTKEKHLKRIKRISKDLQVKESDFEITEEQRRHLDADARRSGFVKAADPEQEQEQEPEPQIQKMESMDEWRTLVKEKHDNLEKVVKNNLPSLWLAIEFVLSIRSIMNIAGVTLPWFGIILGRASSLKTAAIEMLRDTIDPCPIEEPRPQATCPKCGITDDVFHMKTHITNCEGTEIKKKEI
jgi:hypothetical protein